MGSSLQQEVVPLQYRVRLSLAALLRTSKQRLQPEEAVPINFNITKWVLWS